MSTTKIVFLALFFLFALANTALAFEYEYGSFFGGSESDYVHDIASSDSGFYICGGTYSATLPGFFNGHQQSGHNNGMGDGYISFFNNENRQINATYFSGSLFETVRRIAVSSDGVIAGCNSMSFDIGDYYPAPEHLLFDSMVVKFKRKLSEPLWAFYLYNTNYYDRIEDIVVDSEKIIVALNAMADSLETENNDPCPSKWCRNSVLLTLDNETGEQIHYRYMWDASITSICPIGNGDFLVAGVWEAGDSELPVTLGAYDLTHSPHSAGFIALLDQGFDVQWLTYLGGNSINDDIRIVWHEESQSVIAALTTTSRFLPVTNTNWWPNTYNSFYEAYICALSSNGQELLWGGYLGGSSDESPFAVSVDNNNNLVVGITTDSDDMPLISDQIYPVPIAGTEHGYLATIDLLTKEIKQTTYLPGNSKSINSEITLRNSNITVAGYYREDDYLSFLTPTPYAIDTTFAGSREGFIISISDDNLVPNELPSFTTAINSCRFSIEWNAPDPTAYQAFVTRGSQRLELPVSTNGQSCFTEEIMTASAQQVQSVYTVYNADQTQLFEYVLEPVMLSAELTMDVYQDASAIYMQSAGFTADQTRITLYDLRGRSVFESGSNVSFVNDRPTHILNKSDIGRIPSGTYFAVATFGNRRITGKFQKLD